MRETIAALPEAQRNEGAAMKAVMPKLRGEADGARIRALVHSELSAAP